MPPDCEFLPLDGLTFHFLARPVPIPASWITGGADRQGEISPWDMNPDNHLDGSWSVNSNSGAVNIESGFASDLESNLPATPPVFPVQGKAVVDGSLPDCPVVSAHV